MEAVIKNDILAVKISSLGAELKSIEDKEGTQYLWHGDPAYWSKHAPNLFPYIGRLTDDTYTLDGIPYKMCRHGFAAKSDFKLEDSTQQQVSFVLEHNDLTREAYPWCFALRVCYSLTETRLVVVYQVDNLDYTKMYFAVGGHPGFCVPLESNLSFEDYYLEFSYNKTPIRIGISDTGFCTGRDRYYPLKNGCRLPLSHSLFDNDAIVLKNVEKTVTLKSDLGTKAVRLSYPDMQYIGLWHKPATDAPFLCIEPWTSLPSRLGVIEELTFKEDMISLPAGSRYINEWMIDILNVTDKSNV